MKLSLDHDYPGADPRQLWDVVTSLEALHEVCAPLLVFDNVPRTGRIATGDSFAPNVRLFGKLPPQPYEMTATLVDDAAMHFQSQESGAGVRQWDHHLWVHATDSGAMIHEEITIRAGLMTPLFWLWGRTLYRHRHAPRKRILARLYAGQ